MAETIQMPTCPMAEKCKSMMEKRHSGLTMMIPGLLFIVLGVTIIVYPQILVWLVAFALIAMGVAMLLMVNFMRNFGRRFHTPHV